MKQRRRSILDVPLPSAPGTEASTATPDPGTTPAAVPYRLFYLLVAVVLPILCFASGFSRQPRWQSGRMADYAQLLLSHKSSSPLYPFLLYSMTCMTLLVIAPRRFVRRFVIRFGVYTGVLLAVQYWVIFAVAMDRGANTLSAVAWMARVALVAVGVTFVLGWLGLWLFRRFGTLVVCLAAVLILVAMVGWGRRTEVLCLLWASPWVVVCYGAMARYALHFNGVRRLQFTLKQLLAVTAWVAGFLAAWRISVVWMLHEYTQLPAITSLIR